MEAVKTIIYYLKITKNVGINYGNTKDSGKMIIKSYSNYNYVGNYSIKKSISDFIFILNGGLIS